MHHTIIPRHLFFSCLCLILVSVGSYTQATQKPPVYVLTIQAPATISNLGPISAIYHGTKLYFENGVCQLPENVFKTFFSLIITPLIEFKKNGTCLSIERIEDMPCKWYNLTLSLTPTTEGKRNYSWQIVELERKDMPLRIPEHSGIIVQLPADYIDGLASTQHTGHLVINVPSIVIDKAVTQEQLDTALGEVACAWPELSRHCSQQPYTETQQGNTIMRKQQ